MFKESNKDIAVYRVNRGQGVSEDYMILGKSSCLGTDKKKLYWDSKRIVRSTKKIIHFS